MKIGFIGGGNMAAALIGGLIAKRVEASFVVIEPNADARGALSGRFAPIVLHDAPHDDLAHCDALVFAVKPQQFRDAASTVAHLVHNTLVISIAAGIRTADIARWLDPAASMQAIVRGMPNTPALIGAGMTGLYATPPVDATQRQLAQTLLGAVGETLWLADEHLLDAVTAVSGSGPAYVFYFIEAITAAARELGLSDDASNKLALATFTGAAQLAAQSDEPIAALRERVTSKGGTTHAALASMEESKVHDAIVHAVRAAAKRSEELGDEFGKD